MKVGDVVKVSTTSCPWMSSGDTDVGVIIEKREISRRRGTRTSTHYQVLLPKGTWEFSSFLVELLEKSTCEVIQ